VGNFTLNLYKAFGIYKQDIKPHRVYFHGIESRDPEEKKSARAAIVSAVNHIRQAKLIQGPVGNYSKHSAMIEYPDGGMSMLSLNPKTGNLTLKHEQHGDNDNAVFHQAHTDLWTKHAAKHGKTFGPKPHTPLPDREGVRGEARLMPTSHSSYPNRVQWAKTNFPDSWKDLDTAFKDQANYARDENTFRRMNDLGKVSFANKIDVEYPT